MTPLTKNSARALALGTTGALVAGLIAAASPASAAVNVDVAPTKKVSGSMSTPLGIEDDGQGNIYVASANNSSVVVHRKNASGPSTPLRTITGIPIPRDVALDSNGFLYVSLSSGDVRVYAPGASGAAVPVKTFGTGAGAAFGLDIAGGEIYVRKANGYNVYAPSASGFPAPVERAVTGTGPGEALAVHGSKVWTQNSTALRAYARTAEGTATPIQTINNAIPSGTFGLDTDTSGRVYATVFGGTVRVYSPSAEGNDPPLKVLGGPATNLTTPTGVAVLANGSFAVAEVSDNTYRVYRDPFAKPVTRPGKVRALKVGGKQKAKTRKVAWKAPASNGGAKITSYRIIVKKGGTTLVKRSVGPNRRSTVIKRSALRKGVNTVYVQAKNSKGYGPVVKRSFRVRK